MNNELTLEPKWKGKTGTATITARFGDDVLHHDTINLSKKADRDKFLGELCKNRPGLDVEQIGEELMKMAVIRAEHTGAGNIEQNLADLLVELAGDCEFFHDENRIAYTTLQVGDHFEITMHSKRPLRI